ncbi:ABC transporter ATP-binding protein [Prosthecomicrobium hirschii]|uniref:ABC transporter ATP-binding protein n=1 Tax=Prosthecodimorpha hirschii TaxID=665126 RepID=UPI00221E7DD5|nr:ABC transporter ATP-binding protein [Prosthecomicrobium hirschii]MCW1842025.1 ABC transporter ATP-binding protein [Prosthecomicrobium hirschii]
MPQQGTAVAIEGLEVGYGRTPVLDGIDLAIEPGSFVALLGASGCGKTTLLRSIAGFIEPRAGRILIGGRDVTGTGPERRGTAMMFQSYALWPHMSVARNIGYGLKLRGWPRADIARRVDEILALVEMSGFGGRSVTTLSGGQRQRVALGRALAVHPPVLLLDEPLSNLDAKIRLTMRHEIRALQRRIGFTAIHVTHDQEEAMVMADRLVILEAGRIVQDGRPEDVYRRPNSPTVASFLGADNVIEAEARRDGTDLVLILAGGICARIAGTPSVEGPCLLHFRANAVTLAAREGRGDCLAIPGRIEQSSYPGGRYRYQIGTPVGRFFVDDAYRLDDGATVTIAIPAPSLHVFARPLPGVPATRAA